jgi:DNA mismatch repair protein MutH
MLPPQSQQELLLRAEALAGQTLADVAAACGIACPIDARREKGWGGQLLEHALGADAANRSHPDFVALGIELKTIPVDVQGKPLESTFVCSIALREVHRATFYTSRLWQKLQHVLWFPIICPTDSELKHRRLGMPILWRPDAAQTAQLQQDWQELTDMIVLGQFGSITARLGEVLQVRPKAANSAVVSMAYDAEGELAPTLPRGFYLRPSFTHQLLASAYG